MNQHLYVIGIDGGGTKTNAVLCTLDGAILAEAQGGPSNFQNIGTKQSANTIIDLVETCCHSVGCSISQIGAVVAGLAGAGRSVDIQLMTDEILASLHKRNLLLNKIIIESDARIALEGAFNSKPGIIVIAGTGSIVFAKNEREKMYRAGGWGRLIGDEGSGYSIGREAFRAIAKSLDGHGEKTKLEKLFLEKYGLGTQETIINALYKENFSVASVVPVVMEAAVKGDNAAKKILAQASSDLIEVILVVIKKMNKGLRNAPKRSLAIAGNLLTNENIYSHMVRTSLKRKLPFVSVHEPELSPVVGAALMAIKNMNCEGRGGTQV